MFTKDDDYGRLANNPELQARLRNVQTDKVNPLHMPTLNDEPVDLVDILDRARAVRNGYRAVLWGE